MQLGNVLWLALVLLACFLWRRETAVIAAVTLLLVLPWTNNMHQNIFFPNQAGLRYLMFPCAVIACMLAGRGGARRAALPFGILAGAAILWNAETGIPVAAGLA